MKQKTPPSYSEPNKESLSKIKNPAIRELKQPIEKILETLQENIKEGKYQYIIGEDTSGRIPTLIFDNVLKAIAKKKHINPPQTIFFVGESTSSNDVEKRTQLLWLIQGMLKEIIKHHNKDKNTKTQHALVVTDTIVSGDHLKALADVLKMLDIKFDITTIGFGYNEKEEKEKIEKFLGGKIFFGDRGIPSIYRAGRSSGKLLAGVRKVGNVVAEPYKKQVVYQNQNEMQEVINQSREDVKILSDYLINWFEEKF